MARAPYAVIVLLDEIDKISRKWVTGQLKKKKNPPPGDCFFGSGRGRGRQGLLEVIEVRLLSSTAAGGRKQSSSRNFCQFDYAANFLLSCGGCFSRAGKVIRLIVTEKSGIGFNAAVRSRTWQEKVGQTLKGVSADDLVRFGLIPEFVAVCRLLRRFDELDKAALIRS